MPIYRLDNTIQNYAWGSTTAIAELLGQSSPSSEPQAELWMGTHPQGPSSVVDGDECQPLEEVIKQRPVEMLGRYAADRFGHVLPFLFKVLAADRPLSIQAHPDKKQAAAGFAKENQCRKPLNASDRNYRDDNHKPEIICALSPFWALNGFRSVASAVRLLEPICPPVLNSALEGLGQRGESGLQGFFQSMLMLAGGHRAEAVRHVRDQVAGLIQSSPVYRWIAELVERYPADAGVLAPAVLNLILLQPGQAMFLPAGQLHAYLSGVGIELMANSDNVLRGGLTPKHVDVAELLKVVRFKETPVAIIEPEPWRTNEVRYPCPAAEFVLSVLHFSEGKNYLAPVDRSVEILLCTSGHGRIDEAGGGGRGRSVKQGDCLLVPAGQPPYMIRGEGVIHKATVPLPSQGRQGMIIP